MAFSLPDHWVWDFWTADDGNLFHLFYLHAPKSLPHPDLRHRNARIGHATSPDLVTWTNHGQIFEAGREGSFDDTANWTGSVVRGADNRWYLYYTGSHWLSPDNDHNIESIGLAVSDDLFIWHKRPGPVCSADARWYETYGTSSWTEEAWRDPWVFAGADGKWHMLITARANAGDVMPRGVVGYATSADMESWQVHPPLSASGCDFAHLEVLQVATIGGQNYALFSCNTPRLAGRLAGKMGGIWWMRTAGPTGPFDIAGAQLLAPQDLYAGRLVQDRAGRWNLMGFDNRSVGGTFSGTISDPLPLIVDPISGDLALVEEVLV